jgi:hypothetical protein
MIRHYTIALRCLGLLAAATAAIGCGDSNKPPAYGSTMSPSATPTDTSSSMTAPPIVVPAGATPLASGPYNQIQFTVPEQSGMLYILDESTSKVVTTNSIGSDGGKSMSMPDLGHTVQGLSTSDTYRIFFAPSTPTTHPIGGM